MESLPKLWARRAEVHEQMKARGIGWDKLVEDGEDIPQDQEIEFDKWNAEFSKLDAQIERLKKLEDIEARDSAKIENIIEPEKREMLKLNTTRHLTLI